MTKRLLFLLLAGMLLIESGCDGVSKTNDDAAVQTRNTNVSKIVFTDGTLTILGVDHRFPIHLADLTNTLGPPDRVAQLENHLSTWDKHGIVAYEKKPGDPVQAIAISFTQGESDFSPKKPFIGVLEYHGHTLSRDSTRNDLTNAGLIQDDRLTFLHVADDGDFKLIAEFNDELVEFSINHQPPSARDELSEPPE